MAVAVSVPNVPGVPPVLFAASSPGALTLMTADTYSPSNYLPQWGIFLNGAPVITADTVVDFTLRKDWIICDFPLEQGAFESYNKVFLPYDVRLRFVAGGSESNRTALLASVEANASTLSIYSAVTPEMVYPSINIKHYDYRRTSINGVGMITVDVWCEEVRISSTSALSNTAQPSGASQINGGSVQGTTPSATQSGAISSPSSLPIFAQGNAT